VSNENVEQEARSKTLKTQKVRVIQVGADETVTVSKQPVPEMDGSRSSLSARWSRACGCFIY